MSNNIVLAGQGAKIRLTATSGTPMSRPIRVTVLTPKTSPRQAQPQAA